MSFALEGVHDDRRDPTLWILDINQDKRTKRSSSRKRKEKEKEKQERGRTNGLIDSLEKTRGFCDGRDPVGHATDSSLKALCEGYGLVVDAGAKDKQLGISLHASKRDELSV